MRRTKAKAATPAVSATSAPAVAIARRSARPFTRNSCRSASRRNHSETKPIVGGMPARVSEPRPKAAPLTGWRRPAPRSVSRSSVPSSEVMKAAEANRPHLATAWARTCRLAASRPTASRSRLRGRRPGEGDAVADRDETGVLDARVGDGPVQARLHGGEGDPHERREPPEDEDHHDEPDRRTAEDAEEAPQPVEADVYRHARHRGPAGPGAAGYPTGSQTWNGTSPTLAPKPTTMRA